MRDTNEGMCIPGGGGRKRVTAHIVQNAAESKTSYTNISKRRAELESTHYVTLVGNIGIVWDMM